MPIADLDVALDIFASALSWLRDTYSAHSFYVERDLVWTLQKHLVERAAQHRAPLRIFNDYPVLPGKHRGLSADLVLVDNIGAVLLATEFKYEPGHLRPDIQKQKLPVVFWGADGVAKDVARISEFVESGRSAAACALFLDEGRYFRQRAPHPGSTWIDWPNGPSILFASAGPSRLSGLLSQGDAA